MKSNVQQNYGCIRRVMTTKRRKRRTWYGNLRFLIRPPCCDVRWLSNLITIPDWFRSKGTRFSSGTSPATGSVGKGCIRKLVQILLGCGSEESTLKSLRLNLNPDASGYPRISLAKLSTLSTPSYSSFTQTNTILNCSILLRSESR